MRERSLCLQWRYRSRARPANAQAPSGTPRPMPTLEEGEARAGCEGAVEEEEGEVVVVDFAAVAAEDVGEGVAEVEEGVLLAAP